MLGAIAGDLAAWTYENDKECFYSSLTSADAELSSLGKAALDTALWGINHHDGDKITIRNDELYSPLRFGSRLLQVATLAWIYDEPKELFVCGKEPFYDDKEGFYAGNILPEIVKGLHQGSEKNKVLKSWFGKSFKELKSSWDWKSIKEEDGLLTYLMRAWDCFEKAWDFTSAIHNAARWEGTQRHLLCSLTGAIAEAMYGCEYRLLKEKYGSNHYNYIKYPKSIEADIKTIQDYQFEHRVFFPKNSALTNVETHTWKGYASKFEGRMISPKERSSILRALYTGWDNRYGFYLDDGWVFTYRSGFLEARFQIKKSGNQFKIANIQCADDKNQFADLAIEDALYSVRIVLK